MTSELRMQEDDSVHPDRVRDGRQLMNAVPSETIYEVPIPPDALYFLSPEGIYVLDGPLRTHLPEGIYVTQRLGYEPL